MAGPSDVEPTLTRLRLGEQVSLIVKTHARPDAKVVKVDSLYLLDNGESLYR